MRSTLHLLLLSLLLAACTAAPTGTTQATDTVTDAYGRTVVVPAQPQRIVSLSPAVTEIIYALGADEMLVGRTDFCTYPPQATSVASIGGISNLNTESVVALRPDLVISGSMVARESVDQLDKLRIPLVCVPEQQQFEGLYHNISAIGRLVGKTAEADSLCAALRRQVADIALTQPAEPASIYYVVGFGPAGNYTACGNTFINDILTMAGARNIAAEAEGWSYSLEMLMQQDPDYILIRREDSAAFCRTQPYTRLTAVRQHRVIAIESGIIDLQVPRNIQAIQQINARVASECQK